MNVSALLIRVCFHAEQHLYVRSYADSHIMLYYEYIDADQSYNQN